MKIASHQPYFFPYLGYFGIIKHTDKWVVFDTAQFMYHGWIERNRILKPVQGWQYIQVPLVKHSHKASIKDIKIRVNENWIDTIYGKLNVYKKIAPYYNETLNVVEKSLSIKTDSLTKLNCHTIKEVCEYLGIKWNYSYYSELNIKTEQIKSPDEWALYMCREFENITEYWNLPGGASFFDREKYRRNNITLNFYNQVLKPYNQKRTPFEPGLSIIDVMMFNSKEELNEQLNNYTFTS